MAIFEAARWAPSAYNEQPWRFIYATKGSNHWNDLFNILVEFNQTWCKNASVLVLIASKKTFDHNNKPNPTHSFDAGAAWANAALQASLSGWVAHGMSGIDFEKAQKMLPGDYKAEMLFAIGKKGSKSLLPVEIQKMEIQSDRKKISEIAQEGKLFG